MGREYILSESSEEPDERLFELVVALSRNIKELEVLLSVESDLLSLDLSVLDVDLVANEHDGDVFANSDEILVPLRDILVGDSSADIEHNDSAVSTNIIAVSKSSELLLACGVPNVELEHTLVGVEHHWVDLDSHGGDVLLLKLSSEVPLDEGSLADTTVTDEHELELSDALSLISGIFHVVHCYCKLGQLCFS